MWGNRHVTEEGYIFHNYTTVTIDSKGSSVFIQTDKPVYKPKQKGKVASENLSDAGAAFKQCLLRWNLLFSAGCDENVFPFLLSVLINLFMVTSDLRPFNDRVRGICLFRTRIISH